MLLWSARGHCMALTNTLTTPANGPALTWCLPVIRTIKNKNRIRSYNGNPSTTDVNPFVDPGRAGGGGMKPKPSPNNIMNCFQHTGVMRCLDQSPRGAPHKGSISLRKHAIIGFTTHAYSFKRLELLARPAPPPLASPHTRHARALTSPRRIGFCAIWDCICSVRIRLCGALGARCHLRMLRTALRCCMESIEI